MSSTRRILFILFVISYLILCPLLILYAFGYIFNPSTQEMTKTGLLYLASTPDGADIFLEKSHFRERTSSNIAGLIPGSYKVSLRLKGYKPWTHTVTVSAGRATVFDNILLVPRAWSFRNLRPESFVRCVPLRGTGYFLVATAPRLGSYAIYEPRRDELMPLVSADSPFYDLPVGFIFTREGSPVAVVTGGTLRSHKTLYVNTSKNPPEILDVSKLFPDRPLDIEWSDARRSKLVAVYDDYLDLVDVESMSLYPRYTEGIKGCGVHEKWIYTLDDENNVFRLSYDKGQKEPLFKSNQFGNTLFGPSGFFKIEALHDVFLFVGPKGQLLASLPPYGLVEKGIVGTVRFKKASKVVYWTKESLGMVDFSQSSGEGFFSIKGSVQQRVLYAGARNITECFLINEGTHLVFCDDNKLFLLEIEPQGDPHVEFIADIKENSSFYYSEDTGCAYYLEPQTGWLNSVQIIPR